MTYILHGSRFANIKKRTTSITAALVLAFTSMSGAFPLFLSQKAFAISAVDISNVTELCDAIQNQADDQVWTIHSGNYGLGQCNTVVASGQTGWYFPITANNITINGVGNPTIYGTGYTANGAWHTQDLVAIFGNNITLNGLTLMPKVEPNKTIEVIGGSTTIENVTITPNTLTNQTEYDNISDPSDPSWTQDAKTWGGSIYYNNATGTQTLTNVTINNGGVSNHAPSATFNLSNVHLSYSTNVDWINDYRFYLATSSSTINGLPTYTYHVNSSLDNMDSVLAAVGDPATIGTDTISLDSDLMTTKQITLTKPVTFNGNGNTISPNFSKTDNDNNSALGIQANDVTVNNLVEDGISSVNLHGINVYEATGVNLNNVTVMGNDHSGLTVNGSAVTVNNLTTANNGWNGVDVDRTGAVLTVNGVSHHTGELADIYVDDASIGQVVDTNNQYSIMHPVVKTNDSAYNLKPAAPTLIYPANNSFINTNNFWFDWSGVNSAAGYEFQASQNPSVDGNGSLNVGVWTGDYQHNQPTASTLHSVGASGTWYWQVRTVDAKGAKSNWSAVWKMTVDMTSPAASNTISVHKGHNSDNTSTLTGNPAYTNSTQIRITWSPSTSSDVSYYWFGTKNNPHHAKVQPSHLDGNGNLYYDGNMTPGNNPYYYTVTAVDKAGNESQPIQTNNIILDTIAPLVSLDSPSNGAIVRGTVDIKGSISDANPDHYYLRIEDASGHVVYSQTYYGSPQTFTNRTIYSWDTTGLNGTYKVYLEARDAAGNKDGTRSALGDSVAMIALTVDNSAPATPDATLFNAADDSITNGHINTEYFTFKLSDTASDVTHYQLKYWNDISGSPFNSESHAWSPSNINNYSTSPHQLGVYVDHFTQGEGTHYFAFSACDAVNNCSTYSTPFTVVYDKTAPVVTVDTQSTPSQTPTVTGTIKETNLSGTTFVVTIDGHDYTPTIGAVANLDGSYPWSVDVTNALALGTYDVVASATDLAGNTGTDSTTNELTISNTVVNTVFTPQLLGVTTNTPNTGGGSGSGSSSNEGSSSEDSNTGEVKGAETTKTLTNDSTKSDTTSNSRFLGLGWWWLLILALVLGFLWFLLGRRDERSEK